MNNGVDPDAKQSQTDEQASNEKDNRDSIKKKMDIKKFSHVALEWKFECTSCHRFIVTSMQVSFLS